MYIGSHKVLNEQCIVNFLESHLNSSLVIWVLLDCYIMKNLVK